MWLSLDPKTAANIQKRYESLKRERANEAKFQLRAVIHFFKDDIIEQDPSDRERKTHFELQWGPVPNDSELLFCPPMKDNTCRPLSFNTNPDCAYWLPLQRLAENHQDFVKHMTYVREPSATAVPYFTIEFKKNDKLFDEAVNQLSITTSLMLFNRVLLRCSRLQAQLQGELARSFKEISFDDIKHYGMAFNASTAHIYIVTPILDCENPHPKAGKRPQHPWMGCRLQPIARYDVSRTGRVNELSAWINEIHNWGLGEHSRKFEQDVKLIAHHRNSSVGRVSLVEDDFRQMELDKPLQ